MALPTTPTLVPHENIDYLKYYRIIQEKFSNGIEWHHLYRKDNLEYSGTLIKKDGEFLIQH